MTSRQQQPYQSYEYYATQLLSSSPEQLSPPRESLIKLSNIAPVEISYQPQPVSLRRVRKSIVQDINHLTKRKSPTLQPSLIKSDIHRQISQRERVRGHSGQKFQTFPTPRVQLQRLRLELRKREEQEEHYLLHNSGIVKDRIRSKFIRHRTDFAEMGRQTKTQPRQPVHRTPKRNRIDRYNHDIEEYLIRKRIGRGEEEAQNHNTLPSPSNLALIQQESTNKTESHDLEEMIVDGRKGRVSPTLYCSNDIEGPRLIIVSPMHPGHAISNFKNYMIQSATKSCSREQPEGLLRLYIDRNFNRKQLERGQGQVVKSPLNYTLFKKQIHKMRKESIGLPLLLENHQTATSGSLLEERIKARKISCMVTAPQEEGRTLHKKYVVFSRKYVAGGVGSLEHSL